jgi:hypothetical protein
VPRFLIRLSLGTVLFVLALWGGSLLSWWSFPSLWKEIVFFLFFITLIITNYLLKLRKKQPQAFVQFYLLSIILKMVAGIGFVLLLIWKAPAEVRGNVGLFIISYLLFTGLEVIFLIRNTSSSKD